MSVIREGDIAKLTVRDTGVGIPPDVRSTRIRTVLPSRDSARSSQTDGAGLGLSLVRWIADQHGAKVGVASQPEHGSTFTFSFPHTQVPVWRIRSRPHAGGAPVPRLKKS